MSINANERNANTHGGPAGRNADTRGNVIGKHHELTLAKAIS
jgi:hypothetical protein